MIKSKEKLELLSDSSTDIFEKRITEGYNGSPNMRKFCMFKKIDTLLSETSMQNTVKCKIQYQRKYRTCKFLVFNRSISETT